LLQSCQQEHTAATTKLELVAAQLKGMDTQLKTIQEAKAQLVSDLKAAQQEICKLKDESSCKESKHRAALVKVSDLENALRLEEEGANATRVQLALAHELKAVQDQELRSCKASLLDALHKSERLQGSLEAGVAREHDLEAQVAKCVPLPVPLTS
jgi:hypothetical protein